MDATVKNMATGSSMQRTAIAAIVLSAALSAALSSAALAQTPDAAKPQPKPAVTKPAPAANAATVAAPASNEGALKARVESLEEQLVDMQVVVGTLESLAKNGGGASGGFKAPVSVGGSSGGADSARVESLEQQVRALAAQVQQLSEHVRSQGGGMRRGDAASPGAFGSTTVTAGSGDAIGGLISGDGTPNAQAGGAPGAAAGGSGAVPPPVTTAALPPAGDGSDPKQLYETAYGYLLQRDYGAAEAAFDEFLKKYPSDSLSGNAQYWLGESHFVRGQYKSAANAFLKGYQTYGQGQKAPDSLLKLAMSLDRMGQKDAACSSFSELNVKFPNAPQSVKARAQSERQRVGCP
jgi:tol-pal system protein YbgF